MKSGYRFGVRLSLFWFFLILFFPSPAKAGPAHTEGPSQQTEWPPDPIPDNGFLWNAKERDHFVRVASGYLGWKYIRGGNSSRGVDCSALVQRVFRVMGIDLPRTAREQFQVGYKVAREALEIGDLVFFKRNKATRPTHVGIYLGDGRFIHASLKKQRVYIDQLDSRYFASRFIGGKRLDEINRTGPGPLIRQPALPGE